MIQEVQDKIVFLRGKKVILDTDVAFLYGVETKRINEAVRNNIEKFPEDYLFQLTQEEISDLRSKISTTKYSPKRRSFPNAFTEKGLYMLATILKSKTALNTTFAIIETFAAVNYLKREIITLHRETDVSNLQHFFGQEFYSVFLFVCAIFHERNK